MLQPTKDPRRGRLFFVKATLAIVVILFAVASTYTSKIISERHAALENTTNYSSAWLAIQATTELERLLERISARDLKDPEADQDEVRLRFDILKNHVSVLRGSGLSLFLSRQPEFLATVGELESAIQRSEPLIDQLNNPTAVVELRHILLPLESELAEMSGATFAFGAELAADDQKELLSLHRKFAGLAVGFITCAIVLICLLVWHNQLLANAQQTLNALANSVQKTSYQLNAALENMCQGLCMVDDQQRLIICNARFLSLFKLTSDVAKAHRGIDEILRASPAVAAAGLLAPPGADLGPEETRVTSHLQELNDGRVLAVSHQAMPHGGWVTTFEDFTERRQVEARLAHMAHHDGLTDLPNRALFRSQVDNHIGTLAANADELAVFILDLDRFKVVNDTLGHLQGDKLLCEVARRLLACEGISSVARFGGDEFAVLQRSREQPQGADIVARRIIESISAPYHIDGDEISIGISVGISIAGCRDFDDLIGQADLALYRAKQEGRGTYRFFDPDMDAELQVRRLMELDLHQALVRDELELYYQPIVALASGEIVGYEALMRWNRLGCEQVMPSIFIPLAEETGLIGLFGNWAIRKACEDAVTWPHGIKVAVNLSPVQFRSRGLVSVIESALARSGLPAHRLELEITESLLLQDNQTTIDTLHDLRQIGARIAMDDFGTGYSSLSYLRSFPFDKIKIDRSFVGDSDRSDGLAILESVASLAQKLNMVTTAEGIETNEQLARVVEAGCTEGQGYLFARPRPACELPHGSYAKSRAVSIA